MRKNLFIPGKMAYVRGEKKPDVECILCALVEESDKVSRLEVYRSEYFLVTLNLYPYAPGHLMIFPKRHITDLRMLTKEESAELCKLQGICLDVLDDVYNPHGFNIGYNIGEAGGASIAHLHLHVVPRYRRELGFIDIIGGVKIIIEDPNISLVRVREGFAKITGKHDGQ
jgi:ATP adenylyltransferase